MCRIVSILFLVGIIFCACQSDEEPGEETAVPKQGERKMAITVSSPAFDDGGMIPLKYTCDGGDMSPPLVFDGVPGEAKSLTLIVDDPDAPMGTWVHWVMYNLPPDSKELHENVSSEEKLENGALHGVTDFGKFGYGGPCPPSGTHRYYFKLYALDAILDLSGQISKDDLKAAMEGHILAEGQLMGKYKRQ